MERKRLRGVVLLAALASAASLAGCATYEVNTGRGNIPGYYIRYEMQEADRAVEAARAEGKDKLCPAEFRQAEAAKDNAYDVFRSCRTEEGAALAKQATAMANALCPPRPPEPAPKRVVPAPPPPAPAPQPPTDLLTVNPARVAAGEAATLSWTSTNAKNCVVEPGVGQVATSGTMTVTPSESATYTLVCTGDGGSAKSQARLEVVAPAPPPPPPAPVPVVVPVQPEAAPVKLCQPAVINVQFDTNKADIKPAFRDELKALADFLKEFPNATGTIEGHTDSVGNKAANMKLSQRRADSVRSYLVDEFGIAPDRIKAVGYGPTKPVADNGTAAGRQQNRRIESNFSCD